MIIQRKTQIMLALMVTSIFLFQSCATIISGKSKRIPVTSRPVRARIIVDGEERGYTPLVLNLKKSNSYIVRVETPGYNPLEMRISRKVSNSLPLSILGNMVTLGLPCMIVAALIGAPEASLTLFSFLYTKEEREKANRKANRLALIGFVLGTGSGILVDTLSGTNFTLSPKELTVTLSKIEGKPQPNFILIDAEQFQDIKWIRIRCADSDKEEIANIE